MLRPYRPLLAGLLFLSLSWNPVFSADAPAPQDAEAVPAEFPSWAVGRLSLKEFGTVFEKLAAFGNQIVNNGGTLARSSTASMLFAIPIDEGLDGKRPAEIFLLDPGIAGSLGPTAMILPLANAKVFEDALVASLDAKKKDQDFIVRIPQELTQPDKVIVVTVAGDWLYVSPSSDINRQLAQWTATAGAPYGPKTPESDAAWDQRKKQLPDIGLSVNIESLWGQYRKEYKKFLTMASAIGIPFPHALATRDQLPPEASDFMSSLKRVDLKANFAGPQLQLEGRLTAQPASALAAELSDESKGLDTNPQRYVPTDSILIAQIKSRYLNYLLQNAWKLQEARLKEKLGANAPTANDVVWPLQALYARANGDKLDGETIAGLALTPDGGFQALLGLQALDPATTMPAFLPVLKQYLKLSGKLSLLAAGQPVQEPLPIDLKDGVFNDKIKAQNSAQEVVLSGLLNPNAACLAAFKRLAEWPVVLRTAAGKDAVLLSAGKESETLLVNSLTPAQAAVAPSGPQDGALMQLQIRPVGLLKAMFLIREDEDSPAARQILSQIQDAPLLVRLGARNGTAWVYGDVPARALQGIVQSIFRLNYANIDITGKLRKTNRAMPGGPESVPAPPPPEQP